MVPALIQILHNPILGGGAALGIAGSLFASLKSIPGLIFEHCLKRQLLVSAQVDTGSSVYSWVMDWLAEHPYTKKARSLSVLKGKATPYMLTPAPGTHILFYKRRLFWVSREKKETKDLVDKESIVFTTFGRDQQIFHELFNDIVQESHKTLRTITKVYVNDEGYWDQVAEHKIRPLESVILPGGLAQRILDDVKKFDSSPQWYQDRGIPHRRGYLFYGPPGNGKSSLAAAIAGSLGRSIYILSLSSKNLDDEKLLYLLSRVPSGHIVLIEDVDAAFDKRDKNDEHASKVTFSGLLNAIDGVASRQGQIIVMSTNHPEKLDPALIRPGRVDVRIELGYADEQQRRELFLRFFPGEDVLAGDFVRRTDDRPVSMARLQTYLLLHREDAVEAAANASSIESEIPYESVGISVN